MKPIISYIYEYRGEKKIRNVGFLKMQSQGSSYQLTVRVKSPLIHPQTLWTLYAFSAENGTATLYPLTEFSGETHRFDLEILLPPESLPENTILQAFDGLWFKSKETELAFVSTWTPAAVNVKHFRMWNEIQAAECITEECDSEEPAVATENDEESVNNSAEIAKNITDSRNFRKIQRQEMSVLPRKSWHLANNSFLLHGYYNYHHLLLVEENEYFLLGVPGIYDRREAHAAELFGFPEFSGDYAPHMNLDAEERNPDFTFGHYLRKIRK